jgi:hypothetical protein
MKRWMVSAVIGFVSICAATCRADDYKAKIFADVPRDTAFYRDVQTFGNLTHHPLYRATNCWTNRPVILTRYEFAVITQRMVDAMPNLHLKADDAELAQRIVMRLSKEFAAELHALSQRSTTTNNSDRRQVSVDLQRK